MGQYLSIGIVTEFSISKEQMHKGKVEQTDVLHQLENTLYFSTAIFDKKERDDALIFTLKREVFDSELLPFLEKFYKTMYQGKDYEHAGTAIEKLKKTSPSEWVAIAASKSLYYFQKDEYANKDTIRFDIAFLPRVDVHYDCILLSSEGKILMEEYGRQFHFLKFCMQEAFKEFALAGALRVYLSG